MKKAKIVLSAVALLAVVGGAFAFKATKFATPKLYYTTVIGGVTTCTLHPSFNSILGEEVATTLPLYTRKTTTTTTTTVPYCTAPFAGQVLSTSNQ